MNDYVFVGGATWYGSQDALKSENVELDFVNGKTLLSPEYRWKRGLMLMYDMKDINMEAPYLDSDYLNGNVFDEISNRRNGN